MHGTSFPELMTLIAFLAAAFLIVKATQILGRTIRREAAAIHRRDINVIVVAVAVAVISISIPRLTPVGKDSSIAKRPVRLSKNGKIEYPITDKNDHITWKKITAAKLDKKERKYVAFEKLSGDQVRIIFASAEYPEGVSTLETEKIVEIPILGENRAPLFHEGEVRLRRISVFDAHVNELFYFAQKWRLFPVLRSWRRIAAGKLESDNTFQRKLTIYVKNSSKTASITLKDWVDEFLVEYAEVFKRPNTLSTLPEAIKEVILSINQNLDNLNEIQEKALMIDTSIFNIFSYPTEDIVPRVKENEEGIWIMYGAPGVLADLIYHHWITDNPRLLGLPKSLFSPYLNAVEDRLG